MDGWMVGGWLVDGFEPSDWSTPGFTLDQWEAGSFGLPETPSVNPYSTVMRLRGMADLTPPGFTSLSDSADVPCGDMAQRREIEKTMLWLSSLH